METLVVVAYLFVAGATLVLAVIAFFSLQTNAKRNRKADEWNKRTEAMRLLPVLSLRAISHAQTEKIGEGWYKQFFVEVKNIGVGPVVFQRFAARQGPHSLNSYLLDTYYSNDHPHTNVCPSLSLGVGEATNFGFFLEGKPVKPLPTKEGPEIRFTAVVFDVFFRCIEIHYIRKFDYPATAINIVSFTVDGETYTLPQDLIVEPPTT